jgi:haloalkane dehalogenase
VDVFRTPDERFEGLPGYAFEPNYIEEDGLRMHYVDEGAGDPVLFLHGEPTWAYLYRKMIPRLAIVARAVAPDYFGFALRQPTRIEDYSTISIRRSSASSTSSTSATRPSSGLGRADRSPARGRAA